MDIFDCNNTFIAVGNNMAPYELWPVAGTGQMDCRSLGIYFHSIKSVRFALILTEKFMAVAIFLC